VYSPLNGSIGSSDFFHQGIVLIVTEQAKTSSLTLDAMTCVFVTSVWRPAIAWQLRSNEELRGTIAQPSDADGRMDLDSGDRHFVTP
jgi:hypothetical protein